MVLASLALIAGLAVGAGSDPDLTEAALRASGYAPGPELTRARAALERHLGAAVAAAKAAPDERGRGAALLSALHRKGSLLGAYDARATTLEDVLERRRYNCVSASVVYNLAAARAGLQVGAELLPTHARSLLSAQHEGRLQRIVVETTSPHGFDPNAEAQRRILAQVAGIAPAEGARALVKAEGEVVGTRGLIGTIYVNRASIAQEAGALEAAERLFALGQSFADEPEMQRILQDQRAALLAQLAADDVLSKKPALYPRAYRSLKAAVKLSPQDPLVRRALFQNLRAVVERMISLRAEQGDEAGLMQLAGEAAALGLRPEDRSGLRAFALSEVARLRIDATQYDRAVEAIDQALREQLGPQDADLRRILASNRVAALRLAALRHAKAGAYEVAVGYLDRLEALPGLTPKQRRQSAKDGLRVVHLVGNKRIDDLDYDGAAAVYRDGLRRYPTDATSKHNLVAVLERLALPVAKAGRCAELQKSLQELELLGPESTFPARARVQCLVARARRALDGDDPKEAVALLREARGGGVDDDAVRSALAVALYRWVQALVAARRCEEARREGAALGALADPRVPAKAVRRALAECRAERR